MTLPDAGFIRLNDVLKVIPISKSSWHAGVATGRYPKGVLLGPRTRAYSVDSIRELMASMGVA